LFIVFLIFFKPDAGTGLAADLLTQSVTQLSNENSMILDQLSDVQKSLLAKTPVDLLKSVAVNPAKVAQLDTLLNQLLR
jgi:hypothetical protein